jgi:hypothetical protein
MDAIQDFEDMLQLLDKHEVRNLIIGGIDNPRHQEDARVLREVKKRRNRSMQTKKS